MPDGVSARHFIAKSSMKKVLGYKDLEKFMEEFSEAAQVRVAKAKLSSDIRWELNRSGKKKLEAPKDKGLNRKLSDRSLKKRGLSTSQGDGASQKDNSRVQKDSKRSKGEGGKLPYDEYLTRREKGLCYVCGLPGKHDLYFPPEDSEYEVANMTPGTAELDLSFNLGTPGRRTWR
ncbi:hypothetical protein VTO42DRAFT_2631 [Malbranchea cinnamomea]